MRDVAVIGVGMTRFGKFLDKGIKDLVRESSEKAIEDAGIGKKDIEAAYVGSAAPGLMTGQEMIKAQVTLSAMGIDEIPMYNVENACASSSTAFHLGWAAVGAGIYDCVLINGFEKLYDTDKIKSFMALGSAVDVDMLNAILSGSEETQKFIPVESEKVFGKGSGKNRSVFMDMYAFYTKFIMEKYGLTQEHFAKIAVKSHKNGAINPHAQHQKAVTLEEVLNSGDVSFPLTRMMCSPVGDGGAAAIICSKEKAAQFTNKPVWVEASVLGSGKLVTDDVEDNITSRVGPKAFEMAGIGPEDIDVIEVHDATSPSEIINLIDLGICPGEDAPKWIDEGYMEIDGKHPSNPSGGLATKGHPIGATGCGQIYEIVNQLRGTAGKRQVKDPKVGMTHNGGGILGMDAAAMAMHIFKR
ncbi:MAG: thiolase family protein [Desulfobacterales bacterium]|nr:thiolase family protein [Desulfobacteraceae bacterium]MBT4363297.1 thiolase family protein [Desulfobacteraceae bacterium]MBT7085117.1 thiolase family protein [Desulfobacterales bacterium]MBT7697758.1 thiolase family protein [Desulfobacterales bacterium]